MADYRHVNPRNLSVPVGAPSPIRPRLALRLRDATGLLALAAAFALVLPASGRAQIVHAPDAAVPRHVTDGLWNSPAGQEALTKFHRLRAEVGGPISHSTRSSGSAYSIGERQTFTVKDFRNDPPTSMSMEFELRVESERFNIWVEVAELNNGHVDLADADALEAAFATGTPAGSYDPQNGIIVNDEVIFGDPPNVDNDGVTDIMWLDIRDDFQSSGLVIQGYFDPSDLTAAGNNRDMVYLDTFPTFAKTNGTKGSLTVVEQVLAHEYQHLIHANYNATELTFVNEAQSEWAEIMNGYPGRNLAFLNDPDEHSTELLEFRGGVDQLLDRQRGQLLSLYVAEQWGALEAGRLTRSALPGFSGYVGSYGLEAARGLIVDFYTANLLNDTSQDPRFGYSLPQYASVGTDPTFVYDGTASTEASQPSLVLQRSTVKYRAWELVSDFTLSYDVSEADQAFGRGAFVPARALVRRPGGGLETHDLTAGGESLFVPGDADRIDVLFAHVEPDQGGNSGLGQSVTFGFTSAWSEYGTATAVELDAVPGFDLASYPVPTVDFLNVDVQLPRATDQRISLYDLLGRERLRVADGRRPAGLHSLRVDVTELPAGLYLLVVETPEGRAVRRITVAS